MKNPFWVLSPVMVFALGGLGSFTAETQTTGPQPAELEKRPHWFPPLAQFGVCGSGPGQLLGPRSVAWGENDSILVADTGNHRIQVFSLEGRAVAEWGHLGSGPGEFLFPLGVARSPRSEVFVLDAGNQRVEVFTPSGSFLREWRVVGFRRFHLDPGASIAASSSKVLIANPAVPGIQIYSPDGALLDTLGAHGPEEDRLRAPTGIAVDPENHVYVADAATHRIRKLDPLGRPLAEWGSWGPYQGFLSSPRGLAFAAGRLFVCDSGNHRVQVFDPSGTFLFQWGAPIRWPGDGQGLLHFPSAIAVSPSGSRVVLCETLEHRCQLFALDKPQALNPVTPGWMNASSEDHRHASDPGRLPAARSMASEKGPVLLAGILDQGACALLVYDLGARSPFPMARMGRPGHRLGEFSLPRTIAMDESGKRFYVLDGGNRRIQVFEPSPPAAPPGAGAATLKAVGALAPRRTFGTSAPSQPEESSVDALSVDSEGNLWILDADSRMLLKFDSNGRGLGEIRLHGDPASGASNLVGLAVGPGGKRIYLLDQSGFQVLAYDEAGAFAFSWGGAPGAEAPHFGCPSGIAADADGYVYVVDSGLHRVWKVDDRGRFVLQWGRYGSGRGEFSSPEGIWLLGRDRIIVDDLGNHRGQVFTLQGAWLSQLPKGAKPSPP